MKSTPNQIVTNIANSASDRILTVGTVTDEQQDLNAEANLTFDGSALQLNGTLTVGANDSGHDVILYGDTASANVTWDTSEDDLILNGAARVVVPDGQLVLGSTAVSSSAAELNALDGYTGSVTELNYLDTLHATGVTDTEFDHLDGVSSNLQTQLDGKSPVAGHSSIATVGTVTTGTWQGTAIASAYLDSDTAHLSGTQTFSGAKTFTAAVTVGANDAGHDVILHGDTASANATWDASEDDLILNGAAGLVVPEGQLTLGSTAIGATAAEINAACDASARTAAAVAVAEDHVLFCDGGATGATKVESIADLMTAVAGTQAATGLTASSGTLVVTDLHPVGVSGAANQLLTDDGDGTVTSETKLLCDGATTTIGNGTSEDTYLKFDGNAVDFRIGIDDGTDTLEIGKGGAHGTTPAIKIDSNVNVQVLHNSAVADGEYSGDMAVFQAGEDLTAGEVVYFKSDGKCWKAVATASATSRCVAMATASISADAMGVFLLKGFARFNSEFPTWTIGGALYTPEAETSGKNVPEQAAPDSDGDFVQVIGFAISGDAVYFSPDSTVVEVA